MTGFPAASAEAVSPPSDREREREVAGREVENGADRHAVATKVGTDAERERVVGIVDPHVEVAAVDDHISEQSQLHSGALELAGQPGVGQAGLLLARRRSGRDLRRVERIGAGTSDRARLLWLEPRPRGCGIRGALCDGVEFFGGQ